MIWQAPERLSHHKVIGPRRRSPIIWKVPKDFLIIKSNVPERLCHPKMEGSRKTFSTKVEAPRKDFSHNLEGSEKARQ